MATEMRRVLIVEDEEPIRSLLASALGAAGYHVCGAPNAQTALSLSRAQAFDAAIIDIKMPGMDGIELSRGLRALDGDLPVIIITAHADVGTARDAIRMGAYDYIAKPFDLDDVLLSVARAAERRTLLYENRAHQRDLEAKVEDRTRQLWDTMRRLEGSFAEVQQAHLESIFILSRVTELNDEYTGNHIRRVSSYCEAVSKALGCSAEFVEQITYSSPMHDIGKISVPSEILGKPGKLTPDEFEIIKQHTINGARILDGIPFLTMAREIAMSHHERYDGTGYPAGLSTASRSSPWPARSRCPTTSATTARATPPACPATRSRSQVASSPSPTFSMRSSRGGRTKRLTRSRNPSTSCRARPASTSTPRSSASSSASRT